MRKHTRRRSLRGRTLKARHISISRTLQVHPIQVTIPSNFSDRKRSPTSPPTFGNVTQALPRSPTAFHPPAIRRRPSHTLPLSNHLMRLLLRQRSNPHHRHIMILAGNLNMDLPLHNIILMPHKYLSSQTLLLYRNGPLATLAHHYPHVLP